MRIINQQFEMLHVGGPSEKLVDSDARFYENLQVQEKGRSETE